MYLYAGLEGAVLPVEKFDLGHGLSLQQAYAHLSSPCIMAFAPAPVGKSHPAPWRPARGGFSYDVTIELRVPIGAIPCAFEPEETIWWIVALLRLSGAPHLNAPATIDMPFAEAAHSQVEPTITPFEVEPRFLSKPTEVPEALALDQLEWLRENWVRAANLMHANPKVLTALRACDTCRTRLRISPSLLTVWGALEQIFAPSAGELRYRVSANMAAYLEPRGPRRLATYKRVLKLYNERSAAAHTAFEANLKAFVESWVFLRNALMKMIVEDHVPSQADFEQILFSDNTIPGSEEISWGVGLNAGQDT